MIKIGIYKRVSTEDQAREGFSLENQEQACRDFIRRQFGSDVQTEVYADVESGYSTLRKNYLRLLEDCDRRTLDGVVVWRVDRFTRNTSAGLEALNELTVKLDVQFYSVSEGRLDFKDPNNKFMQTMNIANGELERNRLIQRVMPGMKRGAQLGHYQGTRHVIWGARYDKKEKRLEWIPEEVKALQILFERVAKGESVHSVAKYLHDQGYRSRKGGPLSKRVLYLAIKREFYCDGYYRWNGEISEKAIIQPIIDRVTWEKAKQTIEHKHPVGGPSTQRSFTRIDSPYILQGVLKCRHCGSNLTGHILSYKTAPKRGNSQTKRVRYYVCSKNACYGQETRGGCRGQWIKADPVEDLARNLLKSVIDNKVIFELAKEELQRMSTERNPEILNAIRMNERQLREVERNQKKLLELHYQNALSADQFKKENQRLLEEEKGVRLNLDQLSLRSKHMQKHDATVDKTLEILSNFDKIYDLLSPKDKKEIYNWVFEFIHVKRLRKYVPKFTLDRHTLRYPFDVLLSRETWTINQNAQKKQPKLEVIGHSFITLSPTAAR